MVAWCTRIIAHIRLTCMDNVHARILNAAHTKFSILHVPATARGMRCTPSSEYCRTCLTFGFARKIQQPVAALRCRLQRSRSCHSQSRMRLPILSADGGQRWGLKTQLKQHRAHRDRISRYGPAASSGLAQCYVLEHGCETHEELENTTWVIWIELCKVAVIPLCEQFFFLLVIEPKMGKSARCHPTVLGHPTPRKVGRYSECPRVWRA
jgi:hypothetical protein